MRALDLCEVAGISFRQLDHWTRAGYIHHRGGAPGSGHHHPGRLCQSCRTVLHDLGELKAWETTQPAT